jgi:hypothetical protein
MGEKRNSTMFTGEKRTSVILDTIRVKTIKPFYVGNKFLFTGSRDIVWTEAYLPLT